MPDVQIEIQGLKELRSAFRRYPKIAAPIVQAGLYATAATLAKNNLRNNPTPFRTGRLLGSFQHRISAGQVSYFPTANYALYVHEGTGVYYQGGGRIYPKTKRALFWPGAAHPVASIAGMRGNPYMEKLAKKAQPDITKLWKGVLDSINKAIADEVNTASR